MISPLHPEFQELQQRVRNFFANEKWIVEDDSPAFCRSMIEAIARDGWLKHVATSPSARTLCFLRYSIARESALGDVLFAMQGLGSYPTSIAGNQEQKEKYLIPVANGELIAAFAMTEPEAGSDAAAMATRAEKCEGGYVLNGTKTLISNAGLADFYTIFARTSEGNRGITAFLLDAPKEGLEIVPQQLIAAHPMGQLHLKKCFIPDSRRLGQEGEGFKIALKTLDLFRPSVGAAATGMAERAFQEAVKFAKTRMQFGKPLSEFQAIQLKIAEMAQLLQASKLLVWDAASKKDEGAEQITLEGAIAKSYATEAAQKIIDEALQIHGGAGLLKGSITEKLYRDIRALRIYEGTTEILKLLIAQQYFK